MAYDVHVTFFGLSTARKVIDKLHGQRLLPTAGGPLQIEGVAELELCPLCNGRGHGPRDERCPRKPFVVRLDGQGMILNHTFMYSLQRETGGTGYFVGHAPGQRVPRDFAHLEYQTEIQAARAMAMIGLRFDESVFVHKPFVMGTVGERRPRML